MTLYYKLEYNFENNIAIFMKEVNQVSVCIEQIR